MTDIQRIIEPSHRRCNYCDHFGFSRRDGGYWAFCSEKQLHLPDTITPGEFRCESLTIGGVAYGELE